MYNVLLADDEVLDLRGMERFIPWKELQMNVAAVVSSGFAALDYIRQHPIDILITDIRMPIMSGLELSREALQLLPQLKIIFVSGYEDFHYAKQAMELNVQSYVLKPVEDDEMIEVLQKVKCQLDLEQQQSRLKSDYYKTLPMLKNDLLLGLLDGQHGSESTHSDDLLLEQCGISPFMPHRIAVIEIDDVAWKLNACSEIEAKQIINRLYQTVLDYSTEHRIRSLCKLSSREFALVLQAEHITECEKMLSRLIECIEVRFPVTITVGLSSTAASLASIQASYHQAKQALDYKMLAGKSRLIQFAELESGSFEEVQSLEMRLDALFAEMSNYRLVQIHDELEHVFTLIRRMKSKSTVYNFAIQIISRLDAYLAGLNENLFQMLGMRMENLDILFKFETMDDIQSWLRRRVFEISEMLHVKKQKKNNKLLESVCAYVEEHLAQNIALRDVSNLFSFSPNHLGVLFKQGTGINFSDYVVERRMEKACELLRDPHFKIFEVAGRVGYKNLTYFSRQFKDKYGMTPGEYRKQC
ncbi:response regulator [Paenibacillus dokdonensis]|uniref:Response regulator n=1 Tax=Paenibacillus dokdonensis TaxID=2567944 RepID=A0ABU6GI09_9BACL|nr:response regulator [Paenibacillus dokdonensis]MEC0238737.1 response regulator [Paenibacillus dokdonensis]